MFHATDQRNRKAILDLMILTPSDPVDLQELFARMSEVVQFREMPPEGSEQPSEVERSTLQRWLGEQLHGEPAKALAEKLKRFEYGNVVSHTDLFSGEYEKLPGSTLDRRWLISEYIFNEKINRLLNYVPKRTIYGVTNSVQGDSGVHWSPKTEHGNKFRRTITNPFLLPEKVGVRYYGKEALTTGHLLTMVGNAKRVAGHMTSESVIKSHYPSMYALMQVELQHREILRFREEFLNLDKYMDRLLLDIYGDEHKTLLPKLVRVDIPFPGMRTRKFPGEKTYRIQRPEFINGLDKQDIGAVFRSMMTYWKEPYKFTVDETKAVKDSKGEAWAPYRDEQRAEYEKIILQAESDWFMEGLPSHRIRNRVEMMKIFWDHWDMELIYQEAKKRGSSPAYKPLNDAEMQIITETIKKHRKKGDNYKTIIDKCISDWTESFKRHGNLRGLLMILRLNL